MKKKYKYKFYYINNPNNIFKKKNFILSAFNLSFLAYFLDNQIKFNKNLILWPDGIFSKFYLKSKKLPGFKIINKIQLPQKINKIIVFGNLDSIDYDYLKSHFKKKILHKKLKYGRFKEIIKKQDLKLGENCLCLITLPTPKQEQLADSLVKKNKSFKIICIGGGLSIASGKIEKSPQLLSDIGLEWFWRLKTDTIRRLKRLFFTFIIYFYRNFFVNKIELVFKKFG